MSRCSEWIRPDEQCPRTGIEVRLRCPVGRPDAVGCYCQEHGGEARAREYAEMTWNYLAPASVGDSDAVKEAGLECLRTTEAYVVARQTTAETGGKWEAFLGLGTHQLQVRNPQPALRRGRPRTDGRGAHSFPNCELALAAADEAWCERVRVRVQTIRALRGGILDWGVPVEPLDEPIVIVLEQGEPRAAWDIAVKLEPRSRSGMATFSGLRPSGECA